MGHLTTAEQRFFTELGARLRLRRIQQDIRRTTLAKQAGFSAKTLMRMETGAGAEVALKSWYRVSVLLDDKHIWTKMLEEQEDLFEAFERQSAAKPALQRVHRRAMYR